MNVPVTSRPGPPPHHGLNSTVTWYCRFGPRPRPHGFVSGIALVRTRLTSEFLQNPKPVSLPKGLGRDERIHIRLTWSTPLGDVGSYNPPPLGARRPRWHTSYQGLVLIPNCHIPARALTISRARLHHSMIFFRFGPRPRLHGFVSGNSREQNFPRGHPLWDCPRANSLNFRVPTEPEANDLPKGLVLGRDENIHIRLTWSTPLGDVGSYSTHIYTHTHTQYNREYNLHFIIFNPTNFGLYLKSH